MKVGKATRVAPSLCLNCGKLLDEVSGVAPKVPPRKPKPGSMLVCIGCGHVMIFGNDGKPRNPQGDEFRRIAGDARLLAIQKARGEIKPIVEKRQAQLKAMEQKDDD